MNITQIITESFDKYYLKDDPNQLDIHMKFHEAGIPLPDRDDLHFLHKAIRTIVHAPNEQGGLTTYDSKVGRVAYTNANGKLHREDGPAFMSKGIAEYWQNGKMVGSTKKFTNGATSYFRHSDAESGGKHVDKEAFAQHLESLGMKA